MNVNLQKWFFLLVTIITFQVSQANQSENPWYHVEILVFENNDPQALEERWPIDPGKPSVANLAYLKRSDQKQIQNYELLPSTKYQLQDAKTRLKKQGHRLLFHRAWNQQIDGDKKTKGLHLIGGKRYIIHNQNGLKGQSISAEQNIGGQASVRKQYEMDGVITLTRGRYIHVNTDFVFHKPMKILSQVSVGQGLSSATTVDHENEKVKFAYTEKQNWQDDVQSRLQPLRFSQARRMKSGEVHYLDHPFYGILIMVKPTKV